MVPERAHARLHQPRGARVVAGEAAVPRSRSWASTASRPTAASTRWGDELQYADGTTGAETNNRYPVHYAGDVPRAPRLPWTRPRHLQPRGLHGRVGLPVPLGRRRGLRPGRRSARRSRPASQPAPPASSSGAGTSAASRARSRTVELYLRGARDRVLCPSCSTTRSSTTTAAPSRRPDTLEHRRTVRVRPASSTCSGSSRGSAEAAPPVHLRTGPASRWRVAVPLMRALFFEGDGDPRGWDYPAPIPLRRRPPRRARDARRAPRGGRSTSRPATGSTRGRATVAGGTILERDVPLDVIPVYVRAAAAGVLHPLFIADGRAD